jgi:hypothetical protein
MFCVTLTMVTYRAYILEKGGTHGKIHYLQDLVDYAAKLGLPLIAPQLIDTIQCKPDVRYDTGLVSREKAIAAYEASLVVCAETAKHIRRTTAQAGVGRVRIRISGNDPIDGLILAYHPPAPPFVTASAP